jgi:hypothetical protein
MGVDSSGVRPATAELGVELSAAATATGSTSLTIPRPFVTISTISSFVRARWLFWCQLSELDEPESRQRRNVTGYPFHFDSRFRRDGRDRSSRL